MPFLVFIRYQKYCENEKKIGEKCFGISVLFEQSGRSPKVVALFSATNFSSNIIELLQLHDTIQIKCNYAWIHYNIAIRNHLMI